MHISQLVGKSILLIGFAREGIATFKYLTHTLQGAHIAITDTRSFEELPQEAQTLIKEHNPLLLLKEKYLTDLESFDVIIKIPSLSYLDPRIQNAKKSGVRITSSTNIFYANTTAEIIAVTGSKGKSTTATLIYGCLLQGGKTVELIGNIGDPAISYLGKEKKDQLYVFEMSSYQLEDFEYAPHIGVFVSFFPDHLDHHGNLEEYFKAKSTIALHMSPQDTLIYNASSEKISTFAKHLPCVTIPFNDGSTSTIEENALYYEGEKVLPLHAIHLLGRHNLENLLAVLTVAKLYKISNEDIEACISNFTGLTHRLEKVGTFQEITFYNDAISTTPESTMAAINSMPQKIGCIILGGLDRGYNFEALAHLVIEKEIAHVILLPDSGKKIWNSIENTGGHLPSHTFVSDMKTCVQDAYVHTPKGTICLLSCASPSYSIFKNFEDKGEQFKAQVVLQGNS